MDTLRATTWRDYIGQAEMKKRLDVHIKAARAEDRPLEHTLLVGPPGFGKTALATIIANRMRAKLTEFTMPLTERAIKLMVLRADGIILLDEIHRATAKEQEVLLPILEFGFMEDKKGDRYFPVAENGFTIIGATTERDKLITPLWDRFTFKPDFDDYSDDEMGQIVASMALKAGATISDEVAKTLGRATGGTPRVARNFVLASRDLQVVKGKIPTAEEILDQCRVTPDGLSKMHMDYLQVLAKCGGLTGAKNIQAQLQVKEAVLRDIERILIRKNLITISGQGRELAPDGFKIAGK